MSTTTPSATITDEVTSWPGVTAGTGRRGEFGFRLGRREIGHLHGDRAAHFGFPKEVWAQLREAGRITDHPAFDPGTPGFGARRIESDDDVRDVIALMRLNYDRAVERHGLPAHPLDTAIPGMHATRPESLPFAPEMDIRAVLIERDRGNVLVYASPATATDREAIEALGGVEGQYLGHWHEAMFQSDWPSSSLYVHEADGSETSARAHVRGTFSHEFTLDDDFEAIPIPGHTPGATAYLWDSGEHRVLFTGDSIYLNDGEWEAAVLESSDVPAYAESLARVRELDFDVLAPWAATGGQPWFAFTDPADTRRRIDRILAGPAFA